MTDKPHLTTEIPDYMWAVRMQRAFFARKGSGKKEVELPTVPENVHPVVETLELRRLELNMNRRQFSLYIRVPYMNYWKWSVGKARPHPRVAEKLARIVKRLEE